MWALILTAALGTSPPADVIVFDEVERNVYNTANFRYLDEAPVQLIFWRRGKVVHWQSGLNDFPLFRDGQGCWGVLQDERGRTRIVRGLQYKDTWSCFDVEIEDRHMHGNGWTTPYRKQPSQW